MTTTDYYYSSGVPKYFQLKLEPGELSHRADLLFGSMTPEEYAQAAANYLERLNGRIYTIWNVIKVLAFQGVHGLIGRVALGFLDIGLRTPTNIPAGHPTSVQ